MDAHIIRETSIATDVRVRFDDSTNDPTASTAEILRESASLVGQRIGIELQTHGLLPKFYQRLTQHLSEPELVDVSDLVTDLRLEKSPAEVECMREAGRLFDIGLEAGFATMRRGKRECDVHAAVMSALYAAGGEFPAVAPPSSPDLEHCIRPTARR